MPEYENSILPMLDYNLKLHTVLLGYSSYLAVMYMSENIGTATRENPMPKNGSTAIQIHSFLVG